jgi:hypothetical protein
MILSMITPLIYMGVMQRDPQLLYQVYFSSYILAVPVIGSMVVSRKCRRFWVYLCFVICFFFVTKIGAQIIGNLFPDELASNIYQLCMNVITVLVAVVAYIMRIYRSNRKRAREISDASFIESMEVDKPNTKAALLFVAFYLYALNLDCPQVCDLALYSSLLYLLFAVVYEYIKKTEDYLRLNEDACQVRNIPVRRIYGIGKAFLVVLLGLLMLTVIPAILTINNRSYNDIRKIEPSKRGIIEYEFSVQPMMEIPEFDTDMVPVDDELSPMAVLIVDIFIYGTLIFVVLLCAYALFLGLRKMLRRFEQASVDEEDVVESLDYMDEGEKIGIRRRAWIRTEEDKMRRRYRKFIRRHRKDRPAKYETPTEIETAAGVADTVEGMELHKQYELARYGNL